MRILLMILVGLVTADVSDAGMWNDYNYRSRTRCSRVRIVNWRPFRNVRVVRRCTCAPVHTVEVEEVSEKPAEKSSVLVNKVAPAPKPQETPSVAPPASSEPLKAQRPLAVEKVKESQEKAQERPFSLVPFKSGAVENRTPYTVPDPAPPPSGVKWF